jgi:hypothetical protein
MLFVLSSVNSLVVFLSSQSHLSLHILFPYWISVFIMLHLKFFSSLFCERKEEIIDVIQKCIIFHRLKSTFSLPYVAKVSFLALRPPF